MEKLDKAQAKKRNRIRISFIIVFSSIAILFAGLFLHSVMMPGVSMPESTQSLNEPSGRENTPDKSSDKGVATDLNGNRVDNVDTARTEKINQVSDIGKVVRIPSLRAEFRLGQLDEVDGLIEPTNYTNIFHVRNIGVDYNETDKGTTYMVAHAMQSVPGTDRLTGVAPGNFFFNPATGAPLMKPGDKMDIDGETFVYQTSENVPKSDISNVDELWDSSIPNRLIFITCLSGSEENMVSYWQKDIFPAPEVLH